MTNFHVTGMLAALQKLGAENPTGPGGTLIPYDVLEQARAKRFPPPATAAPSDMFFGPGMAEQWMSVHQAAKADALRAARHMPVVDALTMDRARHGIFPRLGITATEGMSSYEDLPPHVQAKAQQANASGALEAAQTAARKSVVPIGTGKTLRRMRSKLTPPK